MIRNSCNTLLNLLAEHIQNARVNGKNWIRDIRIFHKSNAFSEIFELLPGLTGFPAVILSPGTIVFDGINRDTQIHVILMEQTFSLEKKAQEAHTHLEELIQILDMDPRGRVLTLEKVPFLLEDCVRMDYEDDFLLWDLTLTAKE